MPLGKSMPTHCLVLVLSLALSLHPGAAYALVTGDTFGDGKDAVHAIFSNARQLTVDPLGNIYIVDSDHGRIRRIDSKTNVIDSLVEFDYSQGAVDLKARRISYPISLLAGADGTLYIGTASQILRLKQGKLEVLAGQAEAGEGGDAGPAAKAKLNACGAMVFDPHGDLVFLDLGNHRIRRLRLRDRRILRVAGDGKEADSGDGGPALKASLSTQSLAADGAGNLYFLQDHRVRRIDAKSGRIHSVAGNGSGGMSGDGGPALKASIGGEQLLCDRVGNLYIHSEGDNRIRRIRAKDGRIDTVWGKGNHDGMVMQSQSNGVQLISEAGMALNSKGRLVVVSGMGSGNQQVIALDPENSGLSLVAGALESELKAVRQTQRQEPDLRTDALIAKMKEAQHATEMEAFKKQASKDSLFKVTENSYLDADFHPLPGAAVLLAVGIKRWNAQDSGSFSGRSGGVVALKVTRGEAKLSAQSLEMAETAPGQVQSVTVSAFGDVALVWVLLPENGDAPVRIEASFAKDGERKDFVDRSSVLSFEIKAQAPGDQKIPDRAALDKRVDENAGGVTAAVFRHDFGSRSGDKFSQSRRVVEYIRDRKIRTLTCEFSADGPKNCKDFEDEGPFQNPLVRHYPLLLKVTHWDPKGRRLAGYNALAPQNGSGSVVFECLDFNTPERGITESRQLIFNQTYGLSESRTSYSNPKEYKGFRYWGTMSSTSMLKDRGLGLPDGYESHWELLRTNEEAKPTGLEAFSK
jgi:hypothetical protein